MPDKFLPAGLGFALATPATLSVTADDLPRATKVVP